MTRRERTPGTLPTSEEIRRFVTEAPGRVGKREIAREFGIAPDDKLALRAVLAELRNDGSIAPAGHRRFTHPARTPDSMVVRIIGTDPDGEAIGRPVDWPNGTPPTVFMRPERRDQPSLVPGERVLAQLRSIGGGKLEGRTLRRLTDKPGRLLGIFQPRPGGTGRLEPIDRRVKAECRVPVGEDAGAQAGEIVAAEPLPHGGAGLKPVRIVERLGPMGAAGSISRVCIATHEIPDEFAADTLAEAARAGPVTPAGREDLRAIPLVTIDGEDARDFDDAVWAEPEESGFRLIVAIADVAHYVRPGSPLDREARHRGNSVYFPDRVVPMLPEALSNGWCSLRPGEDRGCLFAEIRIGADGRKIAHRFGRGILRSAARLTYAQAQEQQASGRLAALFAAYRALLAARKARGTLDLDLVEQQVILRDGRVEDVRPRPRFDSHRLIEEFMILANVAAAEELERLQRPCLYRVHAPPSDDKLEALRTVLHGMELSLPPGNQLHPRDLERLLQRVAGTPQSPLVSEIVLRSQSQAAYAFDNIGHFGLALPRYAHFTSPIRRYADLLVHRALTTGFAADEAARLPDTAAHISATERRAALAERDAVERYLATFLTARVGAVFPARVSGVQRFGIFVTLTENGANGLVPASSLPDDFWAYDEATQSLSGRKTNLVFRLGQRLDVRLADASTATGALLFALAPAGAPPP
ncbi:MAG: VacB/RNase II family 3'-5' exoribonuclease [Acetobacteraceae bacterium]|nr:VacB/RNase II family 3'-5' exoribonuclease [Acetobacteraceae bacterium]